MKKTIIAVCALLMFLPSLCFAAQEVTFRQMSQCLLVNLASTNFVRHNAGATWESGSSTSLDRYHDDQIICIIGILGDREKDHDVILDFELVSGEWFYILDGTDTRYKRPFGLQIFGRGKPDLNSASSSHVNLGSQYNVFLGTEDSMTTRTQVVLPKEYASQFQGIWWDMCLVFDNPVNTASNTVLGLDGQTYNLAASNTYYSAQVHLTITWGDGPEDSESYEIFLNGYYKPEDTPEGGASNRVSSVMNITRMPTANSIDIRTLFTNFVQGADAASQTKTDVAAYNYTTNSLSSNTTGKVYMFLSSVSNGKNAAETEFILRHVAADGTTSYRDTNHNAVKYYAYLNSNRGHSSTESSSVMGTSVQFDGTSYFSTGIQNGPYLVLEVDHYVDQDGGHHSRWFDTGTISVAIPSNQSINGNPVTVDGLIAGQYTSNIYLHIVTDINI